MTFRKDSFLCPDVEKISNFHPDVKNLHFSVQSLKFVLKRSVIGPIMHENAIKHENIGFRGVFRRRSTRYNGIFFCLRGRGFDCRILVWGGVQLQGFRWTSDSCILGWSCFIWMMPEVVQLNVFQLEYKMTIGLPRSHPLTLINNKILEPEVHLLPVFTFAVISFFYEIFSEVSK